jgi:hypothetical protein
MLWQLYIVILWNFRRSNHFSCRPRSEPSSAGPGASYSERIARPLVATRETSQVRSRQQRQYPAESRINLTGARTTNWRAFSNIFSHLSPHLPRIFSVILIV